jgi:hypothetical protein
MYLVLVSHNREIFSAGKGYLEFEPLDSVKLLDDVSAWSA